MRNKVILGILIGIMIISTVFMSVSFASVKQLNSMQNSNTLENVNSTRNTNQISNVVNESAKNSLNTTKVPENKATKKGENLSVTKDTKEEYITEDDLIYSNKYLVKGKIIYRIDPKTSIKEFKKNIEIAKGQEIKIYKGKEEVKSGYIGTGMKVKGTNGEEYTTCVIADLTGEGIANQVELTRI